MADTPLGRHPLGTHLPLGQTPPPVDTLSSQTSQADTHPRADIQSPEMATEADGTHPTGMHSCFCIKLDPYCKHLPRV